MADPICKDCLPQYPAVANDSHGCVCTGCGLRLEEGNLQHSSQFDDRASKTNQSMMHALAVCSGATTTTTGDNKRMGFKGRSAIKSGQASHLISSLRKKEQAVFHVMHMVANRLSFDDQTRDAIIKEVNERWLDLVTQKKENGDSRKKFPALRMDLLGALIVTVCRLHGVDVSFQIVAQYVSVIANVSCAAESVRHHMKWFPSHLTGLQLAKAHLSSVYRGVKRFLKTPPLPQQAPWGEIVAEIVVRYATVLGARSDSEIGSATGRMLAMESTSSLLAVLAVRTLSSDTLWQSEISRLYKAAHIPGEFHSWLRRSTEAFFEVNPIVCSARKTFLKSLGFDLTRNGDASAVINGTILRATRLDSDAQAVIGIVLRRRFFDRYTVDTHENTVVLTPEHLPLPPPERRVTVGVMTIHRIEVPKALVIPSKSNARPMKRRKTKHLPRHESPNK